eukprot:177762-Chlamydomonas_euryale.AAC.2
MRQPVTAGGQTGRLLSGQRRHLPDDRGGRQCGSDAWTALERWCGQCGRSDVKGVDAAAALVDDHTVQCKLVQRAGFAAIAAEL